jgi:hypothetical protein
MNSFDIESTLHRFLILVIGGEVAVLVFFLIIHYSSKPKPAGPPLSKFGVEQTAVAKLNEALLSHKKQMFSANRPSKLADRNSGNGERSLAGGSPAAPIAAGSQVGGVDVGLPAAPALNAAAARADSPSDGARMVRLILVNNAAYQQVDPQAGAYFPKPPCFFEIHYFAAEPYVALTGLPADNGTQTHYGENGYFQGNLRVRGLSLEVRNGLLTTSGQLGAPVLLSVAADASQPDLLIWPAGCQVIFEAKSDSDGHVSIKGRSDLLAVLARVVGADSQKAVRLLLSLPAAKCTNEVPISGLEYDCDCAVSAKSQSKEQNVLLQRQLEAANVFDKLFQSVGGASSAQTFWQELDEKCQLVTQGRLGVTGYDFSGDAPARKETLQLVMGDLGTAPNLESGRKEMFESTVTAENLEVLASVTNRLAWEKNLAQIIGQLNSARQNLATVTNSKVAGEFRYAGSGAPIGRLSFAPLGPTRAQILAQIHQLDYQINQLQASLFASPATAQTARARIQQLQQERAALAAKLSAFPATSE